MNKNEFSKPRAPRRTKLDWFGLIMMFALLICSLAIFARVMATNMLTTTYLVFAMVALLVVNALHIFVQLPLRRNKLGKLLCGLLAIVLCAAMLYGTVAVGALQSAINKVSGILVEKEVTAVIVMENDDAQSLGDTYGYTYGILSNSSAEIRDTLLAAIQKEVGSIEVRTYDNPAVLVSALYDDEVQAIILNEGYIPVLEGQPDFTDFSSQTRIIYEHITEHAVENIKPSGNITKQPFAVYCSGSDARYGDITEKGRSDVNILAVVNPGTHQVLLINTPRDYYLPLDFNGEMDKLTHASMYGVQEPMAILDNLYGTETNYYARINFSGLIDVVDALDGIDVYSDVSFSTVSMDTPDGYGNYDEIYYSFDAGMNHLTGREALAYSRERSAFSDGDNRRGVHQMQVITAILQKACSSSILANYQDVLSAVADNFVTNMPYEDITALIQLMQKDFTSWNIQSIAATQGYGDTSQYCYSAGSNAWVMPVDADRINQIKDVIAQLMNGEEIVLPEE